jgi:hypothetical protein
VDEPIRVLYLEGDPAAARYLRNVLNGDFRMLEGAPHIDEDPAVDLCVLSDLPLTRLAAPHQEWLVQKCVDGMGLLTVGGWNSYGRGLYADSDIADQFPVRVETGDDRVNLHAGAAVLPTGEHVLTDGLNFDPPPMVAGFNRVRPRRGARVVLEARRVQRFEGSSLRVSDQPDPLLVVSEMTGRAAALATDLAPHWSAGLTDWGHEMVHFGDGSELGDAYVDFVRRLVTWCAGRTVKAPPTLTSH